MASRETANDLNLTPFIGLFAMLVVLLLTTSAWTHLQSFKTKMGGADTSETVTAPSRDKVQLAIVVDLYGVRVFQNGRFDFIRNQGDEVDFFRLSEAVGRLKQMFPDRKDILLKTDDRVMYERMISVFDLLIDAGWIDVGVDTQ